jgi:hypothetical protein
MAKKTQTEKPDGKNQEQEEPLEQEIYKQSEAPTAGEELYVVEAGGEKAELTIDQLMELARLCLEMKLPDSKTETGAANGALADVPELLEFVKNYPDVLEFPSEVEQEIISGKKPLDAYRSYENEQLRRKLRALEQKEANKRGSIGSAKGDAGLDGGLDELMAVYNSVFR